MKLRNTPPLHVAAAALLLAFTGAAISQQPPTDSVQWSNSAVPVPGANGERVFRLQFNGRIAPGYIVYGSDFEANLGPNPTRLRLDAKEGVAANGKLLSAGTKAGKDKAFNSAYTYFEGEAQLSQLVAVAPGVKNVAGTIRGQTCYEADGTCQLFSARFDVALP
jgi:thiol:disulfide interchange protein DsbD